MTLMLGVLGSVTPPGRLSRAIDAALLAAAETAGLSTRLLDLATVRLGFADGRPPASLDDDSAAVVAAVSEADVVLFASPVYRGSFTGALKNLLDLLPVEALAGKPCGIVAMGATAHHYLGVDRHLRDVLAWFGALVAPTSVYLTSADFTDGAPSAGALAEMAALARTTLLLRAALPAGAALGPAPLAARRG
ncbi:MAG: NADPH-dependent FMN reductase [Dehalococcoidia bacterium]